MPIAQDKADLRATMRMETANSDALSAEIEDLSADIAGDEAELKISVGIREKEAAAFAAEESADKEFLAMFKEECAGTDAEWGARSVGGGGMRWGTWVMFWWK